MNDASRVPWWLVPNVVALDAPMVAVVWQRFLGAQFGVDVSPLLSAILGLVVWGIYLADRLLDARAGHRSTARHRVAADYAMAFRVVAVGAMVAAAVGCFWLPTSTLCAGAGVALGVAGYLVGVHLLRSLDLFKHGLKECLVGIGFAAGVAVPLIASDLEPSRWIAAVATFGGVCWLNCRMIDAWETARIWRRGDWCLTVLILVGCLCCPRMIGLMLALSLLLLFVVQFSLGRSRMRLARVCADLVLLTPIVPLLGAN